MSRISLRRPGLAGVVAPLFARDRVEREAPGVTAAIVRPLDFQKFLESAGAVSLYWRSSGARRTAPDGPA